MCGECFTTCVIIITILSDKKTGKFKEWVEVEETASLRYSPEVFAVVGHLARETVRKVRIIV